MHEVDPSTAVQRVQAFHHVIRLAWPQTPALIGSVTRPLTPRHEGGHRPEPCFLGTAKRLDPSLLRIGGGELREQTRNYKTIGCI